MAAPPPPPPPPPPVDEHTIAVSPNGPLTAHFPTHPLSLSSLTVHGDDHLNTTHNRDVAPPIHTTTTFRYHHDPDQLLVPFTDSDHIYSRITAPTTTRLEALLTTLLTAPSLTYPSGLAAFHALLVHLRPRRIALSGGYHGIHGVIRIHTNLTGLQALSLDDDDAAHLLEPGDILHVETPLNPTGEARNLAHYAQLAHARGAYLVVDATFAPPPLQDPFAHGADAVLHSGTKYLGGHSDMLCGVLATRHAAWHRGLKDERVFLGGVMGSLEGWLGVRSLRTLELRVLRQSASAERLVAWLAAAASGGRSGENQQEEAVVVNKCVDKVLHASLQEEAAVEGSWLRTQMPRGWGPVFAIVMRDEDFARRLPSKLALFHHATSLGGVESLIEWRAMSDNTVARTLLRVSVGVEAWEDLREDLLNGFRQLLEEREAKEG